MVQERTTEVLQACLERAPQAKQFHRDAFPAALSFAMAEEALPKYLQDSRWETRTYPKMKVLVGDSNGNEVDDLMKLEVRQDGRISQLGLRGDFRSKFRLMDLAWAVICLLLR